MHKRLTWLVVLVLLVATLSGCGSKAIDPLEAYKQAGLKSIAAKTSHQIGTVTSKAGSVEIKVTTDMLMDLSTNSAAGTFALDVPGQAPTMSFKAYLLKGQMYLEVPTVGKYIAYPADFSSAFQNLDANQMIQVLSSDGKPTIEDASFTVNGKSVKGKKLNLTVDPAKMKAAQTARLAGASAETKELLSAGLAAFDQMSGSIPLTVYIDADGYLARTDVEVTVKQNGTAATATMTMEMFDYGKAVQLAMPQLTKENTITFQDAMQYMIPR